VVRITIGSVETDYLTFCNVIQKESVLDKGVDTTTLSTHYL